MNHVIVLPLSWKDPAHAMHEWAMRMVANGTAVFNELIDPRAG